MSRQRPALRCPPPPPDTLVEFPTYTVARTRVLWRVTRRAHGPWWFSSDGSGRFDLPPPHGTCYLAFDPVAALRETIGPGGLVTPEFLAARCLRRLRPPSTWRVADGLHRGAAAHGATLELSTLVPYDCPRQWALVLWEAGHHGVRYALRHLPDGPPGLAVFGKQGERTGWRRGIAHPIDEAMVRRLAAVGVRVAPPPSLAQLRVEED